MGIIGGAFASERGQTAAPYIRGKEVKGYDRGIFIG